ncbi:MAG: YceI family protein [Chitinophagaceae bacterium]|nr:YceI family protein [Chitinophagaceae bacterium]
MKTFLTSLVCFILLGTSCVPSPEADKTVTSDIQESVVMEGPGYSVDTAISKIVWVGTKINGSHKGNLKIVNGKIGLKERKLSSGNFIIDVTSLNNVDLPPKEKHKIETQLKSADFFDVAKYPTARFALSKVEIFNPDIEKSILQGATHTISGNLTLKGVTKNVRFPAKIKMDDKQLSAEADFIINRTLWGMNYKGANNPQDWLISKDLNIKLNIVARKQFNGFNCYQLFTIFYIFLFN